MTSAEITRRGVLTGAAALGAASALAACGNEAPSTPSAPTPGGGRGPTTVKVADVPVGGAVFAGDVVVSQPTAGQFKAFSAVCTHQGCLVAKIEGTRIRCSCHESAFSTVDGSVLNGPATQALIAKKVTVDGNVLNIS